MAMSDSIRLRAEAKSLGIEGYRAMSLDELRAAIKSSGSKSSPNGASAKKSAGRKTAGKVTKPKKSAGRKTAVKAKPAKKSSVKTAARKSAAKPAPAAKTAKRRATGSVKRADNSAPGRILIDNSGIDWKAESAVGASGGNRGIIMKLLRRFKGNVNKVHAELEDEAQSMYSKTSDGKRRTKAEAKTLLRWHISRVKFDFVKDTDQHEGVVRAKATGARKSAPKAKATRKATAKSAGAQKGAQKATGKRRGRPPGSKNKPKTAQPKAKSKTAVKARKSAASRKRK